MNFLIIILYMIMFWYKLIWHVTGTVNNILCMNSNDSNAMVVLTTLVHIRHMPSRPQRSSWRTQTGTLETKWLPAMLKSFWDVLLDLATFHRLRRLTRPCGCSCKTKFKNWQLTTCWKSSPSLLEIHRLTMPRFSFAWNMGAGVQMLRSIWSLSWRLLFRMSSARLEHNLISCEFLCRC